MSISPPAWSPPPGYEQAPSAVEGIAVWRPRPEKAPDLSPVAYTCPKCGASTRYNVAAGGVACEHCGYIAPAKTDLVGQDAQEFEFTLQTLSEAEQGWSVTRQELHCDRCGAVVSLTPGVLAAACPFCASNHVNLSAAPSDQLRPRFLIPFKIQPQVVQGIVQTWLRQGWFHPDDLALSTVVDRLAGMYLPFWTFDARIEARWKAQVGYEQQERYYDHGSKDWKTRTVIDWRWENGQVTLDTDDLLVDGSAHLSHVLLGRIKPFYLNELVQYTPDFLAGWQAQAYEVSLPDAWEQGKATMREMARQACRGAIHSAHVRNFSMIADFAEETWRYILLPVYLATYARQGKTYQVMVNGQTGAIGGQKPVAWWKVWLAIAALLLPALGLGVVGLVLLPLGGVGIIPLLLGFVLLIGGGILSIKFYRDAVASETA